MYVIPYDRHACINSTCRTASEGFNRQTRAQDTQYSSSHFSPRPSSFFTDGQNRIMDPGGLALAAVLPRSTSLESLTLSYNFMMEDAAQALLDAAAASQATLRDIYCEGNLFDDR